MFQNVVPLVEEAERVVWSWQLASRKSSDAIIAVTTLLQLLILGQLNLVMSDGCCRHVSGSGELSKSILLAWHHDAQFFLERAVSQRGCGAGTGDGQSEGRCPRTAPGDTAFNFPIFLVIPSTHTGAMCPSLAVAPGRCGGEEEKCHSSLPPLYRAAWQPLVSLAIPASFSCFKTKLWPSPFLANYN